MTSVSSQVESLSNTVDGIISALTLLGESGESLEAGLMSAQSQLASITAALEGVVTSEELGLISNTLADVQADVREILENNAIIHTLSFQEIKKIEHCTVPTNLENAKKWLIIGCWIGQRVSDLLTLTPAQIRPGKQNGVYVDIFQQKTQKRVTVGVINPLAIKLLTKDFPKKMYPSKFNQQLKEVLKFAGITQMVTAQKYNGKIKRKETGIFPKYAVIASHDLRRSFATNFYSKIPTPLLMSMTGHSRETTFLKYIGFEENRDSYADDFMRSVSQLEL